MLIHKSESSLKAGRLLSSVGPEARCPADPCLSSPMPRSNPLTPDSRLLSLPLLASIYPILVRHGEGISEVEEFNKLGLCLFPTSHLLIRIYTSVYTGFHTIVLLLPLSINRLKTLIFNIFLFLSYFLSKYTSLYCN